MTHLSTWILVQTLLWQPLAMVALRYSGPLHHLIRLTCTRMHTKENEYYGIFFCIGEKMLYNQAYLSRDFQVCQREQSQLICGLVKCDLDSRSSCTDNWCWGIYCEPPWGRQAFARSCGAWPICHRPRWSTPLQTQDASNTNMLERRLI